MKIENALDLVHGGFVRRNEKRRVAGEEDQRRHENCQCDPAFHRIPFISFLYQKIAQKPGSRKKHNIKSSQESDPGAVQRRLLGEQASGRFHGGDQQRRKNRQQAAAAAAAPACARARKSRKTPCRW